MFSSDRAERSGKASAANARPHIYQQSGFELDIAFRADRIS